jgi:hypothetical protein
MVDCVVLMSNMRSITDRALNKTRIKERASALKHAAYSATSILPGENAAAFAKLLQGLVAEFKPSGAMEEDIVARIAHLLWRRNNLGAFRIAQLVTNA